MFTISMLAIAMSIYIGQFMVLIFVLGRMHDKDSPRRRLWSFLYVVAFVMACGLCTIPLVSIYIVLTR